MYGFQFIRPSPCREHSYRRIQILSFPKASDAVNLRPQNFRTLSLCDGNAIRLATAMQSPLAMTSSASSTLGL